MVKLRWDIIDVYGETVKLNVTLYLEYLEPLNLSIRRNVIYNFSMSKIVYVNLSDNTLFDEYGKILGINNFWISSHLIEKGWDVDPSVKHVIDYFESTGLELTYLGYIGYSIGYLPDNKFIYAYVFSLPQDTYTLFGKISSPSYHVFTQNISVMIDGKLIGIVHLIYDPLSGILLGGTYYFSDLLLNLYNITYIGLRPIKSSSMGDTKEYITTPGFSLSDTNIFDILNQRGNMGMYPQKEQFIDVYLIVGFIIGVGVLVYLFMKFFKKGKYV
jgi:hypothetical protein